MASLRCAECGSSTIGRILEKDTFMRSILKPFVENADPLSDLFVDHLITRFVLDIKHLDMVKAEKTREDQARKVWGLLLQVPPNTFFREVKPQLEKTYKFVVQQRNSVPASQDRCLRCAIELLLPLNDVADTLVMIQCLRPHEKRNWKCIIEATKREYNNPAVRKALEWFLNKSEIPVLQEEDFKRALEQGMPCTCDLKDPVRSRFLLCSQCKEKKNKTPFNKENESYQTPSGSSNDGSSSEVVMRKESCKRFRSEQLQVAQNKILNVGRRKSFPLANFAGVLTQVQPQYDVDTADVSVTLRPTSSRNLRIRQLKQPTQNPVWEAVRKVLTPGSMKTGPPPVIRPAKRSTV